MTLDTESQNGSEVKNTIHSKNFGGFLFLPGKAPWVYNLAEALSQEYPVHAVGFFDWNHYLRNRPISWPDPARDANIIHTTRVMPTGYAGLLEPIFRPVMQRMIRSWYRNLARQSKASPYVIAGRPYLSMWVKEVPNDRLIYHNVDDYTLYRPSRADQIQEQEDMLVEEAALVLCSSRHQTIKLRDRHSQRSKTIVHFPHGVKRSFLNPCPDCAPRSKTVGYVGNLTNRVDWRLVVEVASRLRDVQFVFVGGLNGAKTRVDETGWKRVRQSALRLPNVEHVSRVPQHEVANYYWSFAVNWIPYKIDHPFNVASCPTKIMDGLASGRPLVSTPIPECELYPEWISVAENPESMIDVIIQALGSHTLTHAKKQVEFAQSHVWDHRSQQLIDLLQRLN